MTPKDRRAGILIAIAWIGLSTSFLHKFITVIGQLEYRLVQSERAVKNFPTRWEIVDKSLRLLVVPPRTVPARALAAEGVLASTHQHRLCTPRPGEPPRPIVNVRRYGPPHSHHRESIAIERPTLLLAPVGAAVVARLITAAGT